MRNGVREQRLLRGLGQAELAELAGVTRQTVGAIEAERHSPSVDAAMRIARALGVSVEILFATPDSSANQPYVCVSGTVPNGTPVVTAQVGTQKVYAPLRHLLSASESWAMADGFLGDEGVDTFNETDDATRLVVGGCDPLLGLAASILERRRGPIVVPIHLSTGAAISALANGVVHGVVVHGRQATLDLTGGPHLRFASSPTSGFSSDRQAGPGTLSKPPLSVRRWRFASWQVGVASSPSSASSTSRRGVMTIEHMAERKLRTAQREEGAGTQRALQRALTAVGAPGLPGPRVDGHIDAARHVVAGIPAGITMEAAARAFGLDFLPLETHHSELWIDSRYVDHRGAIALVSLLSDSALVHRAQRLPGYEINHMGTEVLAS
jgi:DNA-binding XRE family transcriptional regulator